MIMAEIDPEVQKKLASMTPEQRQKLIEQQCLFCKLVKGEIQTKKIFEDKNFLAFLEIRPLNPGHIVVIPKKHYYVIPQMPDEEAGKYFVLIKKLIAAVFEAMEAARVQLIKVGEDVPHVHIHIVPRYENDAVPELQKTGTPIPLIPKKLTDEQFEEIQKRIAKKANEMVSKELVYSESGKPIKNETHDKKKKLPRIKPRLP